jgi:hypothetical protein
MYPYIEEEALGLARIMKAVLFTRLITPFSTSSSLFGFIPLYRLCSTEPHSLTRWLFINPLSLPNPKWSKNPHPLLPTFASERQRARVLGGIRDDGRSTMGFDSWKGSAKAEGPTGVHYRNTQNQNRGERRGGGGQ